MNKSTVTLLASLLLGLACAGLLVWVWRGSFPEPDASSITTQATQVPRESTATPPVDPNVAAMSTRDPRAAELLAAFQRALLRGDARPREAVLGFKDDAALQRFLARAEKAGLTVLGRVDKLRSVRVGFDRFSALRDELGENASDYSNLGANNLIGIPHPPAREDRDALDQVPFRNDALAFVGATGDRSTWGRGTTIAVLDTGVASDATFGNGRLRTLDIGLGTSPDPANVKENGHGTAVAALAAGAAPDAPGVAPAANVLSIRVTDRTGLSDLFTVSQAIVAAVDAGARIINVSLGGYSTAPMLEAAIGYAADNGALIVAAAGNDQAAQLAWPAADPRVVSVGAVDKAEQQVSFSNSGPQLQLTAPGYGVQSAWLDGQRVYFDGTSASAPIVSGAIAAVMSQNSSLTAAQAAELLGRTANDTGQPGADTAYGRGVLNLGTAMNAANRSYIDTAVASHFYDADNRQMQFTVQNRSGRAVSGMSLTAGVTGATQTLAVPPLAPGETYIAKVPVSEVALKASGSLSFTTQLSNPPGVVDQVPANNKRSSVLTAPAPAPKQ